jgi:sulfide:quinone oxidoreductase
MSNQRDSDKTREQQMTDADKPGAGQQADRFEVLIAGGGVAGLEAAFALHQLAGDRVSLTLMTPVDEFVYRPMAVEEPFTSGAAHRYPLADLAEQAGAQLVRDSLTEVDPGRRVARTAAGATLAYDALVVCSGAGLHERYEHATTVDDAHMDELLHGLVQDVEEGYVKRLAVVIPSPMPWLLPAYELALMCSGRAWDMQTEMTVTVLTPEEAPLAAFGRQASLALAQLLAERHIEVVTSAYCEMPEAKTVEIHPAGATRQFDRVVALPELRGPGLTGLPQDANGFMPIDEYGRVRGVDGVWAAGDATDFPIKHGGVAAQLADTVARSIASSRGACFDPRPFEPELEGVLLTGGRPRYVWGRPTGGAGDQSELLRLPGRNMPPKITARYLTPHLVAADAGVAPASVGSTACATTESSDGQDARPLWA